MNKKGYALLIILILVVIGQAAYTYNLTMKIDRLSHTVANLDADSTINNLDNRIKTIEQELSNHNLSDIDVLKDNVATNTSNIASVSYTHLFLNRLISLRWKKSLCSFNQKYLFGSLIG